MLVERILPNILVTGTPGVGKGELAGLLVQRFGFKWLDVSAISREENCWVPHQPSNKRFLDIKKILIAMSRRVLPAGGNVFTFLGSYFFPKDWIDIVIVLRSDSRGIESRLSARGFSREDIRDNIMGESMSLSFDEAFRTFNEDIVLEFYDTNFGGIVNVILDWCCE